MAYVSRLSDVVKPGVVGESLQEGKAVRVTTSGVHNDLPVLMTATSGEVSNVYVLFQAVDNFERPTDAGLYTANWNASISRTTGFGNPVDTNKTYYRVGKSTLWDPTLLSGELGQAHRGGTYAVPEGAYVDSANIKVPGNKIKVSNLGRWEYTSSESDAVGVVDEYNTANSVLIFTLKQ